jgi:hypothetical protein
VRSAACSSNGSAKAYPDCTSTQPTTDARKEGSVEAYSTSQPMSKFHGECCDGKTSGLGARPLLTS